MPRTPTRSATRTCTHELFRGELTVLVRIELFEYRNGVLDFRGINFTVPVGVERRDDCRDGPLTSLTAGAARRPLTGILSHHAHDGHTNQNRCNDSFGVHNDLVVVFPLGKPARTDRGAEFEANPREQSPSPGTIESCFISWLIFLANHQTTAV